MELKIFQKLSLQLAFIQSISSVSKKQTMKKGNITALSAIKNAILFFLQKEHSKVSINLRFARIF